MNETLQTIFSRRSTKKYLPKPVEADESFSLDDILAEFK